MAILEPDFRCGESWTAKVGRIGLDAGEIWRLEGGGFIDFGARFLVADWEENVGVERYKWRVRLVVKVEIGDRKF